MLVFSPENLAGFGNEKAEFLLFPVSRKCIFSAEKQFHASLFPYVQITDLLPQSLQAVGFRGWLILSFLFLLPTGSPREVSTWESSPKISCFPTAPFGSLSANLLQLRIWLWSKLMEVCLLQTSFFSLQSNVPLRLFLTPYS